MMIMAGDGAALSCQQHRGVRVTPRWLLVTVLSLSLGLQVFADARQNATAGVPGGAAAKDESRPAPADPRIKTPIDHLDLQDGDTVVFLGDSLTMQCGYTQYIEDFYYTRFPHLKINFHNAGVGGDRVFHALDRFDPDVAAYKPKYVTVMFGGNDAKDKQWDAALFEKYATDMLTLIKKIQAIGAMPILMGPAMYDRRALLLKPSPARPYDSEAAKYSNPVMGYYSAYMRDQAGELGLLYADVYSAQNNYAFEQRIHNPTYKMSLDAWHPLPDSEIVMAATFLDAVHAPRLVSSTTASYENLHWKMASTPNGKVSDIGGDTSHLSFVLLEPALPWVVTADAALGYKNSGAGERHSAEPLQIQGLTPGNYEVKIDGKSIGVFPSSLLAVNLDLQDCEQAPQVQQALAVAMLNREKNEKAMHPIRSLYRDLKINSPNHVTPEYMATAMNEMKPKVDALLKLKGEYEQKIYVAAAPIAHRYEIIRTSSK